MGNNGPASKEPGTDGRGERAGEVLENVMVGVDKTWRNKAALRIDRAMRGGSLPPGPTPTTKPESIATQPPESSAPPSIVATSSAPATTRSTGRRGRPTCAPDMATTVPGRQPRPAGVVFRRPLRHHRLHEEHKGSLAAPDGFTPVLSNWHHDVLVPAVAASGLTPLSPWGNFVDEFAAAFAMAPARPGLRSSPTWKAGR